MDGWIVVGRLYGWLLLLWRIITLRAHMYTMMKDGSKWGDIQAGLRAPVYGAC